MSTSVAACLLLLISPPVSSQTGTRYIELSLLGYVIVASCQVAACQKNSRTNLPPRPRSTSNKFHTKNRRCDLASSTMHLRASWCLLLITPRIFSAVVVMKLACQRCGRSRSSCFRADEGSCSCFVKPDNESDVVLLGRLHRSVQTSPSPKVTVQDKVRKSRKVPFKHGDTTRWCPYKSLITSHSQLLQPSLDGGQRKRCIVAFVATS